MCYASIEVQYIESKQIDMHFDLIDFCGFSGPCCKNLKGKKLLSCFVDGHNLAIHDKTAQLIFLSFHIGFDILH